jgi:hypothetical protein
MNCSLVVAVLLIVSLLYFRNVRKASKMEYDVNDKEVIKHLRIIFKDFDRDGDGIELAEVLRILQKIDKDATEEQAAEIFQAADKDASGVIDFKEFKAAVTNPNKSSQLGSLDLAKVVRRKDLMEVRDQAVNKLFILVFLVYPGFNNLIFSGFRCRALGNGVSVLAVDYTIDCNSAEYASLFLVCTVLMGVWSFGLPGMLFFYLWSERQEIADEDRETLQKFSFCLKDYDLKHYYWEVVELLRKLMLTGVIGTEYAWPTL